MANEQNLIPNSERTPSELKEMRKNGGVKSGEVRREKKKLREMLNNLLDADFEKDKDKPQKDRRTNKELLVLRMFSQAMNGDLNSQKYIIDLIGEGPVKQMDMNAKLAIYDERTEDEIKREIMKMMKECEE